jgi:manganese/zinc/iron transport system permease protein
MRRLARHRRWGGKMGAEFVQFSLTPMLIGVFAAIACALPGNFLILRRQALIGDAISHVVLPGIVVAFLVTGTVATIPMLIGAGAAALVAVVLIEVILRLGRIEPGAAMGVVFTALFAGGVLLLEQSDTSGVHLDVDHALMGNLETLIWLRASGWHSVIDPVALAHLPPELPRIAAVAALMAVLMVIFWRPLKLATFDEGFARAIGLPVSAIGLALVIAAAVAAVAAFDAVGSIIVIAMFICPPAAARLLTNALAAQVWISVGIAAGSAVLGYVLAGYGPIWMGFEHSVSAAGMIATVSGLSLALACVWGPHRTRAGGAAGA